VFYSYLLLCPLFKAGLDVMLSVPRRANDAMYVNMLHGYDVSRLLCSDKLGSSSWCLEECAQARSAAS